MHHRSVLRPHPVMPAPPELAPVERPGHCTACGVYHGSVGAELHCLRAALRTARKALRDLGER